MTKEMVMAVARHLLTAAGGALVARGVVDAGSADLIVGGLVAAIGVAWSYFDKRKRLAA